MNYLIATKPSHKSPFRYFTMNNHNGSPRYVAFSNKKLAVNFRNYITQYRCTYHNWPIIDASGHTPPNSCCKHDLDDQVFVIESRDIHERCTGRGICIADVFDFSLDLQNDCISLKASEETYEPDIARLRFMYETLT